MKSLSKLVNKSKLHRLYSTKALSGKISLVTGSTSGIGLKVAEMLANNGSDVMINGFVKESEGKEIAKALNEKTGAKIHFHGADLSKVDQCKDIVHQTSKSFGRGPDILINNGEKVLVNRSFF